MAFTIHRVIGFESGGTEAASSTSGTPAISAGVKRTGSYGLYMAGGVESYTHTVTTDVGANQTRQGNNLVWGFGFYFSTPSTWTTGDVCDARDGSDQNWRAELNSSGNFEIFDSADSSAGTINAGLSMATWYYLEWYCNEANSGTIELFVDGTSAGSVSGDFLNAVGADTSTHLRYLNSAVNNVTAIDDVYVATGATATSELYTNGGNTFEVLGGYNNTAEDATDWLSALDAGTWGGASEVAFSDTNDAQYTGDPRSGGVHTDEGTRSGPATDITGTTVCMTTVFRASRGNGSGTTHVFWFGYSTGGGSTPNYSVGADPGLTTSAVNYTHQEVTSRPTTSSHYCFYGMWLDGARDIITHDFVMEVGHYFSSGSTTPQSVAGSITNTGALSAAKTIYEAVAGAITNTGALSTTVDFLKSVAGSITNTGALATIGSFLSSVAGAITFTGDAYKKQFATTDGDITFSGALASTVDFLTSLAGAITFSGDVTPIQVIKQAVAGAITFAGDLADLFKRPLAGAITFSGSTSTISSFLQTVAGTFTSSGALAATKLFLQAVAGAFTSSGAVSTALTIAQSVAGSISFSGSLSDIVNYLHSISGSFTSSGSLSTISSFLTSLAGSISFSGATATARTIVNAIAGAITFSGDVTNRFVVLQAVAGAITFAGDSTAKALKALAGSINFAGSLSSISSFLQSVAGAITPSGALSSIASFFTSLAGSISFSGAVASQYVILKAIAGAITFTGDIVKATSYGVYGAITFTGSEIKKAITSFAGSLTMSGTLASALTIVSAISGAITFSGSATTILGKLVTGVFTASGSITKGVKKTVSGAITLIGSLVELLQALFGKGCVDVTITPTASVTVSDSLVAYVTITEATPAISLSIATASVAVVDSLNGSVSLLEEEC